MPSEQPVDENARRSAREAFLRRLEAQQRESRRQLQETNRSPPESEGGGGDDGVRASTVVRDGEGVKSEGAVAGVAAASDAVAKEAETSGDSDGGPAARKESGESLSGDLWVPIDVAKAPEGGVSVAVVTEKEEEGTKKLEEVVAGAKMPPSSSYSDGAAPAASSGGEAATVPDLEKEGAPHGEKESTVDFAAATPAAVPEPTKVAGVAPADEEKESSPPAVKVETDEDLRVRAYLTSVGISPETLVVGSATAVTANSFRLEDIFDGSSLDVLRAVVGKAGVEEPVVATFPPEISPAPAAISEDLGSSARTFGSSPASAAGAGAESSPGPGSVVPPLSVVRGAPAGSDAVSGGSPNYSRMASELTMPPSLIPQPEAANLGLAGIGARSYRTDATTVGSVSVAGQQQPIEEEEINLTELEPWQRALFRKMDRHDAAVREMTVRLDALAELVRYQQAQMMMQGGQVGVQQTAQQQQQPSNSQPRVSFNNPSGIERGVETPPPHPQVTGLAPQQQPGQPQQPQGAVVQPNDGARGQVEAPHFVVLPLLQSLFGSILAVPRAALTYLSSTRPVRLLRLFYREAVDRDAFRDFDLGLLFKVIFISVIMASRGGGSSGRRKGKGDDDGGWGLFDLWERHRAHVFLMVAAGAFLVQVGLARFLYDVIVKDDLVGKVWRDEDLKEEEERRRTEEEGGAEAAGEGGGAEQARGAEGGDNAVAGRRGQQDRAPPAAAADDDARDGRPAAAHPAPRPELRPEEEQRNFLFHGGVVRRRPRVLPVAPAEAAAAEDAEQVNGGRAPVAELPAAAPVDGGVLAFLNDIRYLLGSFVLSLLPMWHPREVAPRQVLIERIDAVDEQNRGQADGQQQQGREEDENDRDGNGGGN